MSAGADAKAQTDIVVHGVCGVGVGASELSVRVASELVARFPGAAVAVAIIPAMSGMPAIAAAVPFDSLPPTGIGQPGPPASDVSCKARNPITREMRLKLFTAAR